MKALDPRTLVTFLQHAAKALFLSIIIGIFLALLVGCSTMPIKYKEDMRNDQCLKNSMTFKQAFDEQIGGWCKIIIVSYHRDAFSTAGSAAPNPLAKERVDFEPVARHAIVACEYEGAIWIYDDAVYGSPYPLSAATLRDKLNPTKLAYWSRQGPRFKSAEFWKGY